MRQSSNFGSRVPLSMPPNRPERASKEVLAPARWTPDGKSLVYAASHEHNADLWLLPLTGDRKPVPLAREPFTEAGGVVSPDGRWMAGGVGNAGFPFSTIDVSPDGLRFLVTRPPAVSGAGPDAPAAITVVLNWLEAFNTRGPR